LSFGTFFQGPHRDESVGLGAFGLRVQGLEFVHDGLTGRRFEFVGAGE
jgi:hypothetical protein